MSTDERMVILGGEQPPPEPPARGRLGWVPLLAAGLVGILVVALVGSLQEPTAPTEPSELGAPPDPPSAYVAETTTTLPTEVSALAVGWRTAELAGGTGWGATAVAHGPDGWLAVSEGAGIVAHVSDNGVLWQAGTISDFTGHQAHAAVGEGVLAVVLSAAAYEGAPQAAISVDGGDGWTIERLDLRPTSIDDVAVIGGTVHAFGTVGSGGDPAVWRRGADGWVPLEDSSQPGFVGALVEAPDGSARAFGFVAGSAAAWTVGTSSLERVELELPAPWSSIIEITPTESGGYVGLAGADDESQGRAILASTDLVTWTAVAVVGPITSLTSVRRGSYLAVSESSEELWALDAGRQSTLPQRLPNIDTGRQDFNRVRDVATDGKLVVAAGIGTHGEPLLAVRSSVSWPLSVPRPSNVTWSAVADETVIGDSEVTGVAQGGGLVALRADSRAWLVGGLDAGDPYLAEWAPAGLIGGWPGGLWLWVDGRLQVRSASGSETLAMGDMVEVVGEIDGLVTVVRRTGSGDVQLETRSGDEWVVLGDAIADLGLVLPLEAGFVGDSLSAGERTTVVTLNGVTWTPIDGTLRGGSGVPFVVSPGDPHRVQLLDRWPEVEEVELPTAEALTVVRHGDGLFVLSPGSVWAGDPENGWERIPAGVENGVPGWPALLAGKVPTLVTTAGGRISLFQP